MLNIFYCIISMKELKKINLHMLVNDNDIYKLFKYFDFAEEYDNKDYITTEYEFDYGYGLRKYSNALFIFDVEINNKNRGNFILRNVEYVAALEIFNPNELELLEKYCPCSKCSLFDISKFPPIYKNMFIKYCIGKYKTKFVAPPLVQEARKLKNICEKN
jgi:hypothetical protein